jgi:hypothetical protein
MRGAKTYTLIISTNRGRYALDGPQYGHDLPSGEPIAILLGEQWIEGRIEHAGRSYAIERTGQAEKGYYFIANDGSVCGLCTGMKVRRLEIAL